MLCRDGNKKLTRGQREIGAECSESYRVLFGM
jgi:hypothetical protein